VGLCADCSALLKAAIIAPGSLRALRSSVGATGVLDDVLVLFYFDPHSPLQRLIHRLKYQGARSLGRELGARFAVAFERELRTGAFTGIVPVPLHPARKRERGYNQARLVAEGIRSIVPLPVFDQVLVRERFTVSQTGLSAPARGRNVTGAFVVPPEANHQLRGERVLIVDDVLTTGATLEESARALKSAGARWCTGSALALAR
jgi:ComF family protein